LLRFSNFTLPSATSNVEPEFLKSSVL